MFRSGLVLCLATFVACWSNASAEDYKCSTKLRYDWPREDSCWRYYSCFEGQEAPGSSWCFPIIRRFDRIDRKCTWWFRVDCARDPGKEPEPTPEDPDQKPADEDHKPADGDQKPADEDHKPADGDRKPEDKKDPETKDDGSVEKENQKNVEHKKTHKRKHGKSHVNVNEENGSDDLKTHPKLLAKITQGQ